MKTTERLRPTELLSQLAKANSCGCLEIESELLVSWKIYLHQGEIQYVYSSIQLLDQLKYHLHYFQYKQAIAALKQVPPSLLQVESSIKDKSDPPKIYGKVISWLLKEQHLDLSQTLKLIQNITKDEIQSCLWLQNFTSSWRDGDSLPIWIPVQIRDSLFWNVAECLNENQAKLKQWQNCSQELLSVYQRPYFPPSWQNKPMPVSGSLNHKTLVELTQVLTGRTSIRQLSILLKKDELQVAQILSPYIDEKMIYLHHPPSPLDRLPHIPRNILQSPLDVNRDRQITQSNSSKTSVKTWKIVCIDDSPTILSEIKRFLDGEKFEITAIDDPVQAVSKIFTIKPDLILLDITMPRINGYKLCGLLRSSGKCDLTPIIMVTGNTGLIDKARAKISGATDYFPKPFTKEGLNNIVAKHLQ
ncbi:response regulator [Waterburya agarophytonicola K14]|uniref:Response regulator n=1 Tax=Waterburya agarophytonicola KI4 TaxID=2874699 RepID=A0A964BTD3_9CYAN|nr:response regulator [Waterburya agarophytonicola]MCC0177500.1 response regulator [Waterburya agarophytonicola KI4]